MIFSKKGFTLIELLIVVAIIGILAAIAIPNFLNAQVRAKVAKTVSELRTLNTCVEEYYVDWNKYPFDGGNCSNSVNSTNGAYWYVPNSITTPVAYCSNTMLKDPFRENWYGGGSTTDPDIYERYRYQNIDDTWGHQGPDCSLPPAGYYDEMLCLTGHYCFHGLGPDRYYGPTGYTNECGYPDWPLPYDPTNGTISNGNIMRSQKTSAFK
jgi:prepilin-type N-terminal cleavage/methylation domain-containing protein